MKWVKVHRRGGRPRAGCVRRRHPSRVDRGARACGAIRHRRARGESADIVPGDDDSDNADADDDDSDDLAQQQEDESGKSSRTRTRNKLSSSSKTPCNRWSNPSKRPNSRTRRPSNRCNWTNNWPSRTSNPGNNRYRYVRRWSVTPRRKSCIDSCFRRETVGAVIHARHGDELARDPAGPQPLGVVDILVVEQVEFADPDPCRRQPGQIRAPGRRRVLRSVRHPRLPARYAVHPNRLPQVSTRTGRDRRGPRGGRFGRRASGRPAPAPARGCPRHGCAGRRRRPGRRPRSLPPRRFGRGRCRARRRCRASNARSPCSRRARRGTDVRAPAGSPATPRRRRDRARVGP